jgi:hypothetical protein
MNNHLVPILQEEFGGLDNFAQWLYRCQQGRECLMNLVRQGFLDNAITEVLEEFALAQPEIRKWSASVQAHYDRAGAMLLKGTENSDNSYALQRAIIMLARNSSKDSRKATQATQNLTRRCSGTSGSLVLCRRNTWRAVERYLGR